MFFPSDIADGFKMKRKALEHEKVFSSKLTVYVHKQRGGKFPHDSLIPKCIFNFNV
jgi:hypothetical protein